MNMLERTRRPAVRRKIDALIEPPLGSVPLHPLAQRGDVGHVVPSMPGVERKRFLYLEGFSVLWMHEPSTKLLRTELTKEQDPAAVQHLQEIQRDLDGAAAAVRQLGPAGLVVWLDHRYL